MQPETTGRLRRGGAARGRNPLHRALRVRRSGQPEWQSDGMAKKILAQGKPKRSRMGECSLCGRVTKLTKTHVPPKAAGNSGPARVAVEVVEDGRSSIGLGTPKDGGMWGWWFCQDCNSRTR